MADLHRVDALHPPRSCLHERLRAPTRSTAVLASAMALFATACSAGSEPTSGSVTPPPPVPVSTVAVTLAASSIEVGATTAATATLRDARGNVLTGRVVTWSSANAAIASVSQAGVVTGIAAGGPVAITATSEGVSGSTQVTVTPALVIDGVVYLRSDTVAYPATFSPATPLAGAQITLSGGSAATSANGAFTVQTNVAASSDFVPLTVTRAGYISSWHPWRHAEVGQPVHVGLYPEAPVTRRPGFLKGMILMDAGGFMPVWYQRGYAFTTIDRARQDASANLFAYVEQFMVTTLDIASNTVTIGPEVWNGQQMGTRQHYEELVARARSRGMQFMMWLSLFPYGKASSVYPALYSTPRSNTAFWDVYFGAWQARVLEKTAIARDLGIEYVTLGHNLGYLSNLEPSRWRALIAAIRAQGYTGKLVYFGHANTPVGYFELEDRDSAFLALFDAIGISIACGVQPAGPGDVPIRAQSRQRMRADLRALFNRTTAKLGALPVSILVYLSTPSVHGGVSTYEYIEPAIGPGTNSVALQRTRDYQQQADVYQAAAEVINELALGSGQVMGLLSWGYAWTNELVLPAWAFDRSANVRGKPAEAVLKWWFDRW